MSIRATTTYDYTQLLKYNNFFVASKKAIWIIIGICNLIVVPCYIWNSCFYGFDTTIFTCFIISILILIMSLFICLVIPRFAIKKSIVFNAVSCFSFEDDGFQTDSKNDNIDESTYIKYHSIHKVYETKDCLYIFISKIQAYIIDKNGFTSGSHNDLIRLFVDKIESKKLKLLSK